jgi:hypothetical protein
MARNLENEMKIEIFACGFSVDNGKPEQRGAATARLQHIDSHGREAIRVISEPVGDSTKPQCDIKAAILGLMSIKAHPVLQLRKSPVVLFVTPYVAQLMERDGDKYKIEPKKNAELIRRLREKADLFTDLTVQIGEKEQMQQILDVAKTAAETTVGSDSGTIIK